MIFGAILGRKENLERKGPLGAKDHGKKFGGKLVASFHRIVHYRSVESKNLIIPHQHGIICSSHMNW